MVVVGMSGGVDSAVAAALLARAGYTVVGATLRLTADRDGATEEAVGSARAVADHLGIEHVVLDGRERFTEQVLRPCWDAYASGATPNPCVICNPRVKFALLCEHAARLGGAAVATGHYARVTRDAAGARRLARGKDVQKDQSYFLCRLEPEQLAALRLPLGELTKGHVRELARELGLPNAARAASQDACAAQGSRFAELLCERFVGAPRGGVIADLQGRALGQHDGIHRFTVGQRRGLGVALGAPAYVAAIDPRTARVYVTTDRDALLGRGLRATDVRWHAAVAPGEPLAAAVQIRYRHRAVDAVVRRLGDRDATVRFNAPVRAITPGQTAVFYVGDRVIGGGAIETPLQE